MSTEYFLVFQSTEEITHRKDESRTSQHLSFLPLSAGPRGSRSPFYIRESEREAIVEDTLVAAGHEERV